MSNTPARFLSEIFSIRFGDMIASVGEGIATAQAALDQASLEATLAVYSDTADSDLKLLREIGYQPTFYAIPKASGKMMVALSMFSETTGDGQRLMLMASPLNPTLSNKYSYSGSASAEVTFDIVPVPPNEQIRRVPDVVGDDAAEAASKLRDLGLEADFVDSAGTPIPVAGHRSVALQSPSSGSIVKLGALVTLTLDPP